MSQGDGMNPVRLPNLVETTKVVVNVKEHTGLNGGDPRFRCLQLPDAFRFGHKAIMKRVRIPILGPVNEAWVADLEPLQTAEATTNNRGDALHKNNQE